MKPDKIRNKRKRGELMAFEDLEPAVQRRLFREGDPRVPADFVYTVKQRNRRKKTWEELAPTVQRVLYRQKSPRVPLGWVPPPTPPKVPKERVLLEFSKLTRSNQLRLYREGSPRVPADFKPKSQQSLKEKAWDELTAKQRYRLYRRNDPRVPVGFNPLMTKEEKRARAKKRGGSIKRPWEVLSPSMKVRLYRDKDERVPEGWRPPIKRKVLAPAAFEDLSYNEQVKLYLRQDPRVPKDFRPRAKEPAFKIVPEEQLEAEFNVLSFKQKLSLYRRGSAKVPKSFVPPVGTKLLPFRSLESSKQHELYMASDPSVPEDFEPSQKHLETMHARKRYIERGVESFGDAFYNEPRPALLEGHRIGEIPEELEGLTGHELRLGLKQYLSRFERESADSGTSLDSALAAILEEFQCE